MFSMKSSGSLKNASVAVARVAGSLSERRPWHGRSGVVLLALMLSNMNAHASANDGDGLPGVTRGTEQNETRISKNEEHRLRLLDEHALQSNPASDPAGREKWRAEFYRAAYWFIVANPRYAQSNENQRLLEEVLEVFQADRKTRRVRPVEDVFDLAAERLESRDREAAARRAWQAEVDRFLDEHPVYRTDDVLLRAFDAAVRALGTLPENQNKDARVLLKEAHSIVELNFPGRVSGADAPRF